MTIARRLPAFLLGALLACEPTSEPEILVAPDIRPAEGIVVESGTSFGMCAGYCTTRLIVEGGRAVFVETARGGLPERSRSLDLTAAEQTRFYAALDTASLRNLVGVHGCPDCADGGAERIELGRLRVTFEYGKELAPIAPLQREIRALRARFR